MYQKFISNRMHGAFDVMLDYMGINDSGNYYGGNRRGSRIYNGGGPTNIKLSNYKQRDDYITADLKMTIPVAFYNCSNLSVSEITVLLSQFNNYSYSGYGIYTGYILFRPNGNSTTRIDNKGHAFGPVPTTTISGNISIDFEARVINSLSQIKNTDYVIQLVNPGEIKAGTDLPGGLAHDHAALVSNLDSLSLFSTAMHELFHLLGLGDLSSGDWLMNNSSGNRSLKLSSRELGQVLLNMLDTLGRITKFGIDKVWHPKADLGYLRLHNLNNNLCK